MTGVALGRCTDVSSRFDLGIDAQIGPTMAGGTSPGINAGQWACRTGVIHSGRREGSEAGMTDITGSSRRQVGSCLAKGVGAVVTGCTAAGDDTTVGVSRWPPDSGAVTGIAGQRSRNMCRWLGKGIDASERSTVTANTVSGSDWSRRVGVINPSWRESRGIGVTRAALRRRGNMGSRFAQSVGKNKTAVVTIRATGRRSIMAHCRRTEGGIVGVAGGALSRGRNMGRRLTQRRRVIVATGADHTGRVVNVADRCRP